MKVVDEISKTFTVEENHKRVSGSKLGWATSIGAPSGYQSAVTANSGAPPQVSPQYVPKSHKEKEKGSKPGFHFSDLRM